MIERSKDRKAELLKRSNDLKIKRPKGMKAEFVKGRMIKRSKNLN